MTQIENLHKQAQRAERLARSVLDVVTDKIAGGCTRLPSNGRSSRNEQLHSRFQDVRTSVWDVNDVTMPLFR